MHAARRHGFTLAELLVSMAILGIAMASVSSLFRFLIRSTDLNLRATEATFLAQDKLESLKMAGFAGASSGSDATGVLSRAWTVTSAGGYKSISVTASWNGSDGVPHSYTASSILSP